MIRTSVGILSILAITVGARSASAQAPVTPNSPADPRIWASLSAGPSTFLHLNFLNQNRESVRSATGFRGTLEYDLGRVGGVGLTAAAVTLPVDYRTTSGSICGTGCPAEVKVTSVMATFHAGGGLGLDQVIQASAGVTMFGDVVGVPESEGIREKASDFTVMIGYGLAYGFTPRLSAMVVGDLGLAFHSEGDTQREFVSGGNYSPLVALRGGLRYGLWSRPR